MPRSAKLPDPEPLNLYHFSGWCLQEQFWRENVAQFQERDSQMLRVLLKLLESSREPRTLAVACHDLGQFITFYPAGKSIVTGASIGALLRILQTTSCRNESRQV